MRFWAPLPPEAISCAADQFQVSEYEVKWTKRSELNGVGNGGVLLPSLILISLLGIRAKAQTPLPQHTPFLFHTHTLFLNIVITHNKTVQHTNLIIKTTSLCLRKNTNI